MRSFKFDALLYKNIEGMNMSTHAEDLKLRLNTIELLRTAKKQFTYRDLSGKTGLPVTVLSRYAKGTFCQTLLEPVNFGKYSLNSLA